MAKRDIRELLGKEFIVFDGGFGSQLQERGVPAGTNSGEINIDRAELVKAIHKDYINAGSKVVVTNTFGADRFHIADTNELKTQIKAACRNAREAVEESGKDVYVFYDMAPTGKLLKPLGDLDFEDAVDCFKEQVLLSKDTVDGFIIETMTDLHEVKAAILAVKENTDKPLFCSVTFQENQKMLTGASPEQAVALMEGLGVDMLGINCSLGPAELEPVIMRMLKTARLPLLVQPNAGLPKFRNGETYYDVGAEEFSDYIRRFAQAGISGFGGCCGTTPAHIRACCEKTADLEVVYEPAEEVTRVCGTTTLVEFRNRVIRCGERLNPTGKKKMKLALAEGRLYDIVDEGIAQVEAGADVLDVNVGVPGIDETSVMTELITNLQEVIDLPLQIDSSNPETLEKACRIYNGLPLINSVNGKKEVMDAVFPIVKKYGGTVIGLCIDEDGIPPTAEQRFAIAERIVAEAAKYGIPKKRIVIDSLVLTASAQQKEVIETAKCVGYVTDRLGCATALGLSNVSFGLPNRPLINRTFLVMALYAGLKLPILNPLDKELMGAIDAFEVLNASDENAGDYITRHSNDVVAKPGAAQAADASQAASASSDAELEGKSALFKAIVKGQKHQAVDAVKSMGDMEPLSIVADHLIPALDKVGRDYDKGIIFLPQLMVSAETSKLVFDEIKDKLVSADEGSSKGPVVIATVKNDVHDIGKNIVKVVLQSYGFEVIDLGKDVDPDAVCDACEKYNPIGVGLSALMTTTVVSMENTIKRMKERGISIPVFCGGAVVTEDVVKKIGGDYYGADAMESVRICEVLQERREKETKA
ncbi:MAG: homocysteine S-methyltransferase family protein [Clostridiales bacterium]|nr:homocysteine S-methyltransferase family protein [Clostridiales bacterium]